LRSSSPAGTDLSAGARAALILNVALLAGALLINALADGTTIGSVLGLVLLAILIGVAVAQTSSASREGSHPSPADYKGGRPGLPAGLGTILGARMLGEFGDEPNRYATSKCRKNYAGTSPITRASGTKKTVLARHVRNRRLADAIYLWAFASLTASPGARAFYDTRRAAGDGHRQALRALGNRLVGILHGCLAHHTAYDETIAWAHRPENKLAAAA
jgi:hypothetical protein